MTGTTLPTAAAVIMATFVVGAPPAKAVLACGTPGSCDTNPLVVAPSGGSYTFSSPTSGAWYDPPYIDGFDYLLTGGGTFSSVTTDGALPYTVGVYVGGVDVATLAPGATFSSFGAGVSDFQLLGIDPPFDAATTNIGTAFPVLLDFSSSTSLVITPLQESIPEPVSIALLGTGLAGLGLLRRRR